MLASQVRGTETGGRRERKTGLRWGDREGGASASKTPFVLKNSCTKPLSHVSLFVTPWTVACQAPPSVGFSREGYWSGLLCPPPGDCPDPEIKPASLTSLALAGEFFTARDTWEALKSSGHGQR